MLMQKVPFDEVGSCSMDKESQQKYVARKWSVEWILKNHHRTFMWKRRTSKKGKKGKTYCDSFSMELSVAIYQNNPSKVGKTIRPDSNYRGTGKQ